MTEREAIKRLKSVEGVINNWLAGKTGMEMYKAMQTESYYGLMEAKDEMNFAAALAHAEQFIQEHNIESAGR